MPRRTLAQAIRAAGIVLTPPALFEVAGLDANPASSMSMAGPFSWSAPLEGGLTLQADYDILDGWTVEVIETPAKVGCQLPYEVRKAAESLSAAIADYWTDDEERGGFVVTIADLSAGLELSEEYAEDKEQVQRFAAGLEDIVKGAGPGGWFPIADCKLSPDDLAALWSVGILKVFPRVEAGSYCIEFESDDKLSGRV